MINLNKKRNMINLKISIDQEILQNDFPFFFHLIFSKVKLFFIKIDII